MSDIALYDTLRKIPDVSAAEAKEAVADIANTRDIATKADIAEIKVELKYMRWVLGLLFIMNVAILVKLFF